MRTKSFVVGWRNRVLWGAAALSFSVALCLVKPLHAQAPAPAAEPAAAATLLSIDTAASSITYHMVHKLHKFDAVSKKADGKARILPTGAAQIMVRVPVESFDSGNSNRDAHMKEAAEAAKYPTVVLKGLCEGCGMPATFPTTVDKTIKAELAFHGVTKNLEIPIKVTYESAARIHAVSHLTLSLDEFKIERPSLMFVKVDDALNLDINLVLKL
jgi:polyisoprenoid-binding protein YceI